MKTEIQAISLVLALASTSIAQSINVTSTGVGIGTTAPQGKFEIFNYLEPSATPLMSIRTRLDGVGKYGMIRFGEASQTTAYQKGAIIYESTTPVARGRFHIALENTTRQKGSGRYMDT